MVGDIVFGETKACVPTVFCLEWPDDVKADLVSKKTPKVCITNSGLELTGLILL